MYLIQILVIVLFTGKSHKKMRLGSSATAVVDTRVNMHVMALMNFESS